MQHQLQSSIQRHATTKQIKRTRRKEQKQPPNQLRVCLVFSSFALLLILWLIAVTYYAITMISSSSHDDVIMDGAGRSQSSSSVSSVQSALFNNERRPPLISSEHNVPLVAVSDGKSNSNNNNTTRNNSFLRRNNNIIPSKNTTITSQNQQHPPLTPPVVTTKPKLLSRNPNVILTSSTRGNLGPPTVLNQNPPGTNWIKDRWQAASDMGGTAIKGSHWVLLDFTPLLMNDEEDVDVESVEKDVRRRSGIQMTKIVLDWETAFATDYRIEGRMDRPTTLRSSLQHDSSVKGVGDEEEWCVLYDGGKHHPATTINNNHKKRNDNNNKLQEGEYNGIMEFHESEYGQSPGVKQKLPLHILHTIEWTSTTTTTVSSLLNNNEQSSSGKEGNNVGRKSSSGSCSSSTTSLFRYLRVFIRKPARGWGVSLWQVDVYGTIVKR